MNYPLTTKSDSPFLENQLMKIFSGWNEKKQKKNLLKKKRKTRYLHKLSLSEIQALWNEGS